MSAGEEFIKWIRPAGAAVILVLFIVVTAMLFTVKGVAVEGYTPSESREYYAEHVDELCGEVNERLIPKMGLEGVSAEVRDGVIAVSGDGESVQKLRFALIHYFNEDQFVY
ncbi:MAG: hypothetical protein IJP67_06605 [Oscillospiraceae bacterium]|nr:hypothetical protein [Oscillospiraceae bacterium]